MPFRKNTSFPCGYFAISLFYARCILLHSIISDNAFQMCIRDSTDIAHVCATNATPAIRRLLQVPDGGALLMLDEVGFCRLSRPVLRSLEFYTDFFDFTMLRKKF